MLTESHKQILLRDADQNIAMLCLDEEYPLLEVIQSGFMMMCRFRSDEEWCHFSYNSDLFFIDSFFRQSIRGNYIVIADERVFSLVKFHYHLKWSIVCSRLFLAHEIPLMKYPDPDILQQKHLKMVYDHSKYQQFLDMDYLTKRLELGGGFCIMQHNNPVAWVMTHDDGSVGMLHVLDDYRGRGYARILVQAMSERVRQKGRPVFAHIEPVNQASLNLFQSLGFMENGRINWAKVV